MEGAKKKFEPTFVAPLLELGNIAALFQKILWLEFMKQFEGYTKQLLKELTENFVDGKTMVHDK